MLFQCNDSDGRGTPLPEETSKTQANFKIGVRCNPVLNRCGSANASALESNGMWKPTVSDFTCNFEGVGDAGSPRPREWWRKTTAEFWTQR